MGKIFKPALFLYFVFAGARPIMACPFCSDLIEGSRNAFRVLRFGQGIYSSIVILLLMPIMLIGFISLMLWRSRRNHPGGRNEASSLIEPRKKITG